MEKTKFAKRIEQLRESKGWTKTLVANKLGLKNMATYANWEYGTREPDNKSLSDLASIFDVSTDYLLGKTDNPNPKNTNSPKEIDVKDETVIMTYGGKPLSDADREIVLAATRAIVEQRAREKEEAEKKKTSR